MISVDSINDIELFSIDELKRIESFFAENMYGVRCIAGDSKDYLLFRKYLSATAGGLRRRYLLERKNIFQNSSSYLGHHRQTCFSDLVTRGCHEFQVDRGELRSFLTQIPLSTLNQEGARMDSKAQQECLRLVPKYIYKAIKDYLGSSKFWIYQPVLLNSSPMREEDLSSEELSRHAFAFHRDLDSTCHLKIFINLTETADGCHEFIQGSQSTFNRDLEDDFFERMNSMTLFETNFFAKTLYETFYYHGRFDKESIMNIYSPNNLVRFPTFLGSAWVEDTYGLHRGTPCRSDARSILSITIGAHGLRSY